MWKWLYLMVWTALWCTGCAAHKRAQYAEYDAYATEAPAYAEAEEAVSARMYSPRAGGFDRMRAEPEPEPKPMEAAPPPEAARMVHYEASMWLRVQRREEAIAAITAVVERVEGTVEQVRGNTLVLRVPVDTFDDALAQIGQAGELEDQRLSAADVTEAFTSSSLRLETAKSTLERLQALLAKATTSEEKLQLVKHIQRVTETIDTLQAQVRLLSDLATRSRITVHLNVAQTFAGKGRSSSVAEMQWLDQLSAFSRTPATDTYGKVRLAVPEGLVRLDARGPYTAESPDGASIWAHLVANEPRGTAAFWASALHDRIAEEFDTATRTQVGSYEVVTFQARDETAYHWMVAFRVVGSKLELVQVYLPTPDHAARYGDAIEQVLVAAGGEA